MMAIHRLSVRPRSLIIAAMTCAAVGSYASAQNTLTAGDVAVIGMIANGSPDSFAFVNLVDLPAGTQIYFVDNGWNPSLTPAGFRGVSATDGDGNENLQRLNVTGLIPAGTIISSSASGANYTWATGTVAGTTATYTVPSFSQEGEQIYAFQSSDPTDNPLFTGGATPAALNHIFVFDDTNGFEDGVNTNSGNVPPGLTLGNTAITFNLASPVKVFNTASLTSGTKADWLNAISNAANWSQASSGALPTGTISVVAPSIPSINGVSFSGGPNFAGGQNVTFTVSLTGAPAASPATIQITSGAFVAPVTVSINAPATSGMATATLAPVTGAPQVFTATATAVSNSTGGATSSSFTVYPAASATASPAAGVTVASVGATHTLSATVLAGSVPASNVLVNFQIVSGPNAPQTLSATTNGQGVASIMYNSNGQAGLDTISISGNVSGNGFTTSATQSWAAAGPFFLTELMINSPGTDQGSESIELKGPASTTLAGYSIIVIEGDTGNAGTVDKVIPLSALTTGTNGLLLLRDTESVLDPAPDSATTVFVSDFDPDIENDGNTIVLGYGATPALNSDLDTNNDGTIDAGALAGFIAVDVVAYYNGDTGGMLYGDDFGAVGINLAQDVPNDPDGWTPDQLTRILNPNGGPCAWAASDIFGSFPGPYTFALNEQLGFASNGFIAVGAMQMSLGSMNISSPAILNAPVAVTVNNGDSATLSVTGIATGYQWRRNGQNLSDNGTISGALTRELTINPAGAANQGNYDVVLTSPCGSITTVAVALTVQGGGCTADTNNSGSVTADDIFAFLDAWFAQNGQTGPGLTADFNQSQSVTADDIFAFLDAWFAQNGSSCN